MKSFDHKAIEEKWREEWQRANLYRTPDSVEGKENFYTLVEFPYPSGNLHVGHWYAFAVPDIYVRHKRMQGYNVLYPIGFDSFGLPAENAAIKRNLDPKKWTDGNVEYMTTQLQSMGASFDWSRSVATSNPEYYKWTQYIFTKFFEAGLVYQKEAPVNWCPSCNTVLANEQVVGGECERCGSEVEQRSMTQWFIRITDYAEELLSGLDDLDWPEEIKESQRNWIGKSEGAEFSFELTSSKENSSQKFVLIHGNKASGSMLWFAWMKGELEKRGYEVIAPDLPTADSPVVEEQVQYLLDNVDFGENTTVITHSLGGVVAMKLLPRLENTVNRLVMVAPPHEPVFKDGKDRAYLADATDWQFEYEKVKNRVSGSITVVRDTGDRTIPENQPETIARKLGAELIDIEAHESHFRAEEEPELLKMILPHVDVFTTRADTFFGVTYIVLAPEHSFVSKEMQNPKSKIQNKAEVEEYIQQAKKKSDLERQKQDPSTGSGQGKTGVELKGVYALHPATGEKLPVWVADYVIGTYGTGAVMAVPAHDERDYEFAKKYSLPIRSVVMSHNKESYGVGALIQTVDGTYLFQKRDKDAHTQPGKIAPFGGGGEDDHCFECLSREMMEELELDTKLHEVTMLGMQESRNDPGKYLALFHISGVAKDALVLHEGEAIVEMSLEDALVHDEVTDFVKGLIKKVTSNEFKIEVFTDYGVLVNSGDFDGLTSEAAKEKITEAYGRQKVTYKIRDWSVGRQRYWGCPIPLVFCEHCALTQENLKTNDLGLKTNPGWFAVALEELPVVLPDLDDFTPTGEAPLARATEWKEVECPRCGGTAERAVDTLDTFVDSSWYFLRYLDSENKTEPSSEARQGKWMPVDYYMGGAEHTTMHLLYSRFWYKAMRDVGLAFGDEPYKKRLNRGLILGPDGAKMSKSKGNVIDPDEQVKYVGSDTVRMYLAFIGPYSEVGTYPWDPGGLAGIRRFLERVWGLQEKVGESDVSSEALRKLHATIQKVGDDIVNLKLNTAISAMMELVNMLQKEEGISQETYSLLIRILAPFAPYLCEEIWHSVLGRETSVHTEDWPEYDKDLAVSEAVSIAVQVNGKVRASFKTRPGTSKEELEKEARAIPAVMKWIEGKEEKKVIVVPDKIVNFVVVENE